MVRFIELKIRRLEETEQNTTKECQECVWLGQRVVRRPQTRRWREEAGVEHGGGREILISRPAAPTGICTLVGEDPIRTSRKPWQENFLLCFVLGCLISDLYPLTPATKSSYRRLS